MATATPEPRLFRHPPSVPGPPRAVALLLHGGQARGRTPARRRHAPYLRMIPFARGLRRAASGAGLAVWQLRYRYVGWNEPDRDPLADVRWALDQAHAAYPDVPVVLVGHSMGGRSAQWTADGANVIGVCALAPWIEPGDPVESLFGRRLLIAHGDEDRVTDPARSFDFARRAREIGVRTARFEVRGDVHSMLRRPRDWTRLVREFVLSTAGITPTPAELADAFADAAESGLSRPLSTRQ